MEFFGFTEFSDKTRLEFCERIFDRMDTIYSNWLYGEYSNPNLEEVIYDDYECNALVHMFEILHYKFRPDLLNWDFEVTPRDWLAERLLMTQFPSRVTRIYSANDLRLHRYLSRATIITDCDSDSDDSESVADTPRRSTRVKKQREFYYGF